VAKGQTLCRYTDADTLYQLVGGTRYALWDVMFKTILNVQEEQKS
jgi:hypothetical protein